ncbi:MAG: hypothetical protein M1819_005799 [Sarea resinae]|nr:MAG: hypothetical protein M1819_005799 [Sarea resinae]
MLSSWAHIQVHHAESSTFAPGLTKKDVLAQVLEQAAALMEGQRNWVSVVEGSVAGRDDFVVGFPEGNTFLPELILGPFHGNVACQTIALTRGVCGRAASTPESLVVPDVDAFPGHIACDGGTRSEIVVPVVVFPFPTKVGTRGAGDEEEEEDGKDGGEGKQEEGEGRKREGGEVVAVIDIDCVVPDAFDDEDRSALEELAALLARGCDW